MALEWRQDNGVDSDVIRAASRVVDDCGHIDFTIEHNSDDYSPDCAALESRD